MIWRLRVAVLVLLWALLAYKVWSMSSTPGYSEAFLREFALWAWLGGLVSAVLIYIAVTFVKSLLANRKSNERSS